MRYKGKLIKWNSEKAFGFIQLDGCSANVFIHKTALFNRQRTPKTNDIITFSISKDKSGRICANDATFLGEKLKDEKAKTALKKVLKHAPKKNSKLSIYLSCLFLSAITSAYFIGHIPQKLLLGYFCLSIITFLAYAFDKSKARHGAWRTKESTLHFFSLIGGWPGAAVAQQLFRHKSQKRKFRIIFWLTIMTNFGGLISLYSYLGGEYLNSLYLI